MFFQKCLIFSRDVGTRRYGGDQVWCVYVGSKISTPDIYCSLIGVILINAFSKSCMILTPVYCFCRIRHSYSADKILCVEVRDKHVIQTCQYRDQ